MNFGLIGAGKMAYEHAKVMRELGIKISSVATTGTSSNLTNFTQHFMVNTFYIDWKQMVLNEKLDGLIVATPTPVSEAVLQVLRDMELPTLIEKPGVLNLKHLEDSHKWKNRKIFFGYNRRFYESVLELKKISEEREGFFTFDLVAPYAKNNLAIKEFIREESVHFLDLINFLIPEYELNFLEVDENRLNQIYSIKNNDKIKGIFKINIGGIRNHQVSFDTVKFTAKLKPIEKLSIYNNFKIFEPSENVPIREYLPSFDDYNLPKTIQVKTKFKSGFLAQMSEFLKIVHSSEIPNSLKLANSIDAHKALNTAKNISDYLD
jgi:hypothetical protein